MADPPTPAYDPHGLGVSSVASTTSTLTLPHIKTELPDNDEADEEREDNWNEHWEPQEEDDVREDGVREDGVGEDGSLFSLQISGTQGNASEFWGLETTLDIGVEVKQEPSDYDEETNGVVIDEVFDQVYDRDHGDQDEDADEDLDEFVDQALEESFAAATTIKQKPIEPRPRPPSRTEAVVIKQERVSPPRREFDTITIHDSDSEDETPPAPWPNLALHRVKQEPVSPGRHDVPAPAPMPNLALHRVKQEPVSPGRQETPAPAPMPNLALHRVKQEPVSPGRQEAPAPAPMPNLALHRVKQEPVSPGRHEAPAPRPNLALHRVKQEPVSPGRLEDVIDVHGSDSEAEEPAIRLPYNPEVKVKQELECEAEEEAGRAHLFGHQDLDQDEDPNADDTNTVVEDDEQDEKVDRAQCVIAPRPSTTLYPAVTKPLVTPEVLLEMKQEVARIMKKHIEKKEAAAARTPIVPPHDEKDRKARKRSTSSCQERSPSRPRSSSKKKRDRRDKKERREHLSSPHGGPSSPPRPGKRPRALQPPVEPPAAVKKAKLEAPSSPLSSPQPESLLSPTSSTGSRTKVRVAHTPPSSFFDSDESLDSNACVAEAGKAGSSRASQGRDPRLHGQRDSKVEIKPDPTPDFKRDPRLSGQRDSKVESKPDPIPNSNRDPRLYRSADPTLSPPEETGKGTHPTPPKKKGLLPTPPRHMKIETVSRPEPPRHARPCPKSKKRDDWLPEPEPEQNQTYHEEDFPTSPPSPPSPPKKILPLLPAASHIKMAHYETRSPLEDDYKEPRKSYNSNHTDACGLKAIERRQAEQVWMDDVLHTICQWKTSWVMLSKSVLNPDKFPNLLPKMKQYNTKKTVLQFSNVQDYLEHFKAGLLLELWDSICKDATKPTNMNKQGLVAEIEWPPHDLQLPGNKIRRTYMCTYGSNSKTQFPIGDLVIVKGEEKSTKKEVEFFAYVMSVSPSKLLSDSVHLSTNLQEHYCGMKPTFKCEIKLCVCFSDEPKEISKTVSIVKVKNIYEELEMFKYISDFAKHDLASLVLKPEYSLQKKTTLHLKTGSLLHSEQKSVVSSLMHEILGENPSISVVEGGPGTGKTFMAAALARELIERRPREKRDCLVIITAKSNHQLEIILQKLVLQDPNKKLHPSLRDNSTARIVWLGNDKRLVGHDSLKHYSITRFVNRFMKSNNPNFLEEKRKMLEEEIKRNSRSSDSKCKAQVPKLREELVKVNRVIENQMVKNVKEKEATTRVLESCEILLTTLSSSSYANSARMAFLSKPRKHIVLIVDNASDVTEPAVIKPMVMYGVTDLVLLGDYKQHTPYVPSKWARNAGLVDSLMKRYTNALKHGKSTPPLKLTQQFRLQPEVLRGINEHFYQDLMEDGKSRKFALRPHIWFNCTYIGNRKFAEEAAFVEKLLSAIEMCNIYETEVHLRQQVKVTSLCKQLSHRLSSSVPDFYEPPSNLISAEYDIMIVSAGDSTRERLESMIVALTRAKKSLFVCGNFSQALNSRLVPLLKDVQAAGWLIDISDFNVSIEYLIQKMKVG